MKIQSIDELRNITRDLPFIFQVGELFGVGQVYDGRVHEWDAKTGEYITHYDMNSKISWDIMTLIDYFEENTIPAFEMCQCDLYNVLMVTGCRCGGK